MKKLFTILVLILLNVAMWAQSPPQKMSYQAVLRNNSNALIASTTVGMKISILQGSSTGTIVYTETQTPTTNINGMVSIEVGTGTVFLGTFSAIDWANGPFYIKTETDPAGGTNYSITGTSQLLRGQIMRSTVLANNSANSWNITGNAGTVDGTNFIGTTDNIPLNFKVNNQKAGKIDKTLSNTFFGYLAGNANTTGSNNTANGTHALYSNTTGLKNTANGVQTLYYNTTGNFNTANGNYTLYSNTIGNFNTANGGEALYSNTTGNDNTANGYMALYANTTGNFNTANGKYALYSNTTGSSNTANGVEALFYNTTGQQNTANGWRALYTNTTGSNNTALGYYADVSTGSLTNATAIGSGAIVDASNTIQLGNSSVTTVKTTGAITAGAVTYPNTLGTSGQVLTAPVSGGNAFWATPASVTHAIGDSYGGGIVFYVYDGGLHGLIAATTDQSTGIQWDNGVSHYTGSTGDGLLAGKMNTALIVATQMADNYTGSFAAKICADFAEANSTTGDWYLPSKYELSLLYLQKTVVGGFAANWYFSSTEADFNTARIQNFSSGNQNTTLKANPAFVRAIRAF